MVPAKRTETREGVELTSLDSPLFEGADATKRHLIDYLEAAAEPMLRELTGRPLSVVRVRPGQKPFMQKNLPDHAPDFVRRTIVWSDAGHREIHYPLCDDVRTLLWLGNQRAVEYHPTLMLPGIAEPPERTEILAGRVTHLVLDIDPPEGSGFEVVIASARLVRQALADAGLAGALKTSGSKGVHVVVPVADIELPDAAAATRALAARAERLDPDIATTVSFPVSWDDLDGVTPADFTIRSVSSRVDGDPWASLLPSPQHVPGEVIEEGHAIPVARVAAMHEGKRRKRATQQAERDRGGSSPHQDQREQVDRRDADRRSPDGR